MSLELEQLQTLAADYTSGLYRIDPLQLAVLFYATKFWKARFNWVSPDPTDQVTDEDWDTIQAAVDQLLYEVKNPMIGVIFPFATGDFPAGILPCDGSTFSRVDYPSLYDVLGSAFIVDADNFITPDLRGVVLLGSGAAASGSTYVLGDQGGEETHVLSVGELAAHTHTIPKTFTDLVVAPGEVTSVIPVPILTDDTGSTGSDDPHNNMQPYLAINYGIVAL